MIGHYPIAHRPVIPIRDTAAVTVGVKGGYDVRLDIRLLASPERRAQRRGAGGEHDIEADADALSGALIGIDRVGEPSRKEQEGSIPDPHDHLIRIVRGERLDRRPEDRGLNTRVMEVDGIGAPGVA